MQVAELNILGVKVLTPKRHNDSRGYFSEVYSRRTLLEYGIDVEFVQDNHSLSVERGTVRGLHFQTPPFAQDKLVRVVAGAVFDVVVDLRWSSCTYGKHVTVILSADEGNQLWVPNGLAHGFMTLEPSSEVVYKVSGYYAPDHDEGILWSDPALGIEWPLGASIAVLSEKDLQQPLFEAIVTPFE